MTGWPGGPWLQPWRTRIGGRFASLARDAIIRRGLLLVLDGPFLCSAENCSFRPSVA